MGTESIRTKLVAIQTNLLNFAYTLTSNRDDAYDLLQDTALKVLDNEDKYVDNVNFKGWVFTIMRNIFINNYRRMVRSATVLDGSEDAYQINLSGELSFESPEGAVSVHEINAIIDSFSDDYRVPFSLHLSGYRYAEIAERTGLPLGTVKSRIFFARRRLQQRLKGYRQ